MLLWPSILLTLSIETLLDKVTVVTNVCLAHKGKVIVKVFIDITIISYCF